MGSKPFLYWLYKTAWNSVDLLFPPRCVGCGRVGARFCDECLASVVHPAEPLCAICGRPLTGAAVLLEDGREVCPSCAAIRPRFVMARSWALMEGSVRRAIHHLKYRRDLALAVILAHGLLGLLETLDWDVDMVIPVPLGRQRFKERGYNQAALLAFPLALGLNKPYLGKALVRARETRSQVGLSIAERRRNVANAFAVRPGAHLQGKKVLLVDDVMTTGATLDAAAAALLAGGAKAVYAVTVARAVLHKPLG